jgi:hypothetical protein
MKSRHAGHGDLKGCADLSHPVVAEPAEAFDQNCDRNALDGIEVDGRGQGDRVITRLEYDLARDPADGGSARSDQRAAESRNRGVARKNDDRPTPSLAELAPPHLAPCGQSGHDAPAAARNDARSPHSSTSSSGCASYAE